jgi:uncharacterized protein
MLVHFSALTGFLSFVGFFLGPVVIWLLKKDEFPELDSHFREAINFQISMFLYLVAAIVVVVLTIGLGVVIAIPAVAIIGILDVLFPLIAGVQAYEQRTFRYPLSLRLVR